MGTQTQIPAVIVLCSSAIKARSCLWSTFILIWMDLSSVRRASSAGYRLPERRTGTRPKSSEPAGERRRRSRREPVTIEPSPDRTDPVKQDQMWKDLVLNERRGVQEWWKLDKDDQRAAFRWWHTKQFYCFIAGRRTGVFSGTTTRW